MAQIDDGPATGNGVFVFGSASIEVHVSNGVNSLPPSEQNNPVHPRTATTQQTQVNKTNFFGGTSQVKFLNPA